VEKIGELAGNVKQLQEIHDIFCVGAMYSGEYDA
jgi:hypothetical protein